MQNSEGTGFLKIRASSADGAFPVPGVIVTVTDADGRTIASLRTDASGLTETLALSAPPEYLSQSPAYQGSPYSTYTVTADRDGYYGIENISIPIFDRITAIQLINMVPLTEFSPLPPNPPPQIIETPGYANLTNRKGDIQQ